MRNCVAEECFKGRLLAPTSCLGSCQALKFKMALAAVDIRSKWRPYWIACQTPWPRWKPPCSIARISFSLLFFFWFHCFLTDAWMTTLCNHLVCFQTWSTGAFELWYPLQGKRMHSVRVKSFECHVKWFSTFLPFSAIHTSLSISFRSVMSHYSSEYNVQNRN